MSAQIDPIVAERPRLFGLAYRMLGSSALAEDIVQEAMARWYGKDRGEVANEAAYLTTIVTNLCLDQLKSARAQREQYPGVWLPEPLALDDEQAQEMSGLQESAEDHLLKIESVSLAFMSLLESLNPLERAVFLLYEVFDHSHAEVAGMVGRSEATCRQIYRRAKQSLHTRRHTHSSPEQHERLLRAFLAACQAGDLGGLTALLAEDVVSRGDGGGKASAASRIVFGARAVARLYHGLYRQHEGDAHTELTMINGWLSLVIVAAGCLVSVIQIRTGDELIEEINAIVNPDKLGGVATALGLQVRNARKGAEA